MNSDAQGETQSAWSGEVGDIPSSTDSHSQGRATDSSSVYGNLSRGIVGKTRSGRDSDQCIDITGGILAQLIADAEDQLGEARACIEWYQEKEKEQLKRLENLQKLYQQQREQD